MKAFILMLAFLVMSTVFVFAQEIVPDIPVDVGPVSTWFASLGAFIGGVLFIVEFLKKILGKSQSTPNWAVQFMSWIVGLFLAVIAWYLDLGIFAGITWGLALLYGLGASLVANGIADTKIIQSIFSLFKKK